ncbi:MAG: NAD(P)/FAD-dependent oxidoreductase [Bacteroidetes bacterium]|nr:NAD(P)/FAD-dependent oxidoreductase [Bacteroidota bacterium]
MNPFEKNTGKKNVIVIGGGFAGLQFIQNIDPSIFNVLLIDKLNHHQFQPLFYQVATSQLEPSSISFPFRRILQNRKNLQIRMASVSEIEPENNKVKTSIGDFLYDYLVIAAGCKTNFFGNKELKKHALTLKATYEAIAIRNHILKNFEKIISVPESEKEALRNIVIVGAGPTGVELAGSFAETKQKILPKDYPGIDFSKLNIFVIEGSKHTLSSMSSNAQKASEKYLKDLGVTVFTEVFVKNYDGEQVTLSSGETIKSKNVIWAAGVIGNEINGLNKEIITKSNRIKVNRHNLAEGYDNIFAIGDIAYMPTPKYPDGHPQLANVAIGQAKNLAKNLKRLYNQKPLKEYEYKDLGSMATIGKNKAIVDLPFIKLKGHFAWYVWMFLHLMLILSVRNKLIIFINWAWNYFTEDSALRLIMAKPEKEVD